MKQIVTKIYCDVCKEETNNEEIDIQVIFTTEQNEGKPIPPHLCSEKLNICDRCMDRILIDGKYIYASGAMGSNIYEFRDHGIRNVE